MIKNVFVMSFPNNNIFIFFNEILHLKNVEIYFWRLRYKNRNCSFHQNIKFISFLPIFAYEIICLIFSVFELFTALNYNLFIIIIFFFNTLKKLKTKKISSQFDNIFFTSIFTWLLQYFYYILKKWDIH